MTASFCGGATVTVSALLSGPAFGSAQAGSTGSAIAWPAAPGLVDEEAVAELGIVPVRVEQGVGPVGLGQFRIGDR
jgi:hypothetical protein